MIEATLRANLKLIVRAYMKATGQTETAVSREFYGNVQFLPAFFAGKQTASIRKLDDLVGAIIAKWPRGAEWPALRAIVIPKPRVRKLSPAKSRTG